MADPPSVLRRAIHVGFAACLLYYLIPDPLPALNVPRASGALALAALVTAVEAWRVRSGWTFFLLRDYERKRPAAYYWLGLGCCLALVFFPPPLAALSILGVCLVDPVLGELRGAGGAGVAPLAGFALWAGVAGAAIAVGGLEVPWLLVPVGAAVAVAAEAPSYTFIDDDFVMNLAPLAVMTLVARPLAL